MNAAPPTLALPTPDIGSSLRALFASIAAAIRRGILRNPLQAIQLFLVWHHLNQIGAALAALLQHVAAGQFQSPPAPAPPPISSTPPAPLGPRVATPRPSLSRRPSAHHAGDDDIPASAAPVQSRPTPLCPARRARAPGETTAKTPIPPSLDRRHPPPLLPQPQNHGPPRENRPLTSVPTHA